jgi:hypothetical protein
MSELFQPGKESLESLLLGIHQGKTVLPAFQRRFEWEYDRQEALLRSIINGYPAGSLLFLQYPKKGDLGKRLLDGVEELKTATFPDRVILDGQQRLTTLYQMLYDRGYHSRRAFVSIETVKEFFDKNGNLPESNTKAGIELVKQCIKLIDIKTAASRYGDLQSQFQDHMIPLSCTFGKAEFVCDGNSELTSFDSWKARYVEQYAKDKNERLALNTMVGEIKNRLIKPIESYDFPIVLLLEKTEPHAVCQVFVDINIQQKALSPFEVVAARVWPYGTNLYHELEKPQAKTLIQDSGIAPVIPLKAIALLQTWLDGEWEIVDCGKKALYQIKPENFKEVWSIAVNAVSRMLTLLKAECGVLNKRFLPYSALLASMSAVLMDAESEKIPKEDVKKKLLCWYWCSVFSERYAGGTDTKNAVDFLELRKWLHGEKPPAVVEYFPQIFNADSLQSTVSGGKYTGVLCLILRNRAKDFKTCQTISTSLMLSENIDDHHMFPDDYLEKDLKINDNVKRSCILNRALLDEQTNENIRRKAPSTYLRKLRKAIGGQELEAVLESQLLPTDKTSGLFADDYAKFLAERQKIIEREIKKVVAIP